MTIYFVGNSIMDFSEAFSDETQAEDELAVQPQAFGIQLNEDVQLRHIFGGVNAPVVWVGAILSEFPGSWGFTDPAINSAISLWDEEKNPILAFGRDVSNSDARAIVWLRDGTSTDLTLPAKLTEGAVLKVDIRVEPGTGVKFFIDRSLVYEFLGDVGNAASTVNTVGGLAIGSNGLTAGREVRISEILVADFSTLFAKVDMVQLSDTPVSSSFASGDPALIPVLVDDKTRPQYFTDNNLAFDTSGQGVVYPENTTITPQSGSEVKAVAMTWSAVGTASTTVPNVAPVLEVSGVEYEGTVHTLTETIQFFQEFFEDNPNSAASWEVSDLVGLGYGLKFTS